ncbi:G2/mitotic-specific cyclin CYB1 [Periconia macrospinosa]|uniref:G2/mitotic-specific cyclin CYB1 n=1 Tax=Periconia macrospinosa TaxID=97972 RepID=A0A2V1EDT9_9PLEO|nr:G2/mitotic-specific cyclin CYB1 [Periconia macrospinosa]
MPTARSLRGRTVTNENDENAGSMRVTRAKSAAAPVDAAEVPKKAVTKRATTTNGATQAKRGALGDISNVNKTGDATSKNGKKAVSAKPSLKEAAQPTKVQKPQSKARSTSARDKNSELKRQAPPASGSGIPTKRPKVGPTISSKSLKEEEQEDGENVVPPTDAEISSKETKPAPVKAEISQKKVIEIPADVQDLDAEDCDDPLMVSEYVVEIFEYLKQLELSTMANPNYMDDQNELEWKMRGILVDWLLEVHTRFRLLPETLFLAVNIIDRFLSTKIVQLDRLQLVGVTAMFIASKYEEVLSPHVQNFIHVADDGFTEDEILSAERFVLTALNYDLSYPNPMNFLRRISKADNYDIQTRTLGKYLLEIGCLDHRFIRYPPSQVAAAAMYLARMVLERGPWDATLAHYAGYSEEEIQPVLELMIDYLSSPVVHEAFFKKYASKKFMKASIVLRRWSKDYVSTFGNAQQDATESESQS